MAYRRIQFHWTWQHHQKWPNVICVCACVCASHLWSARFARNSLQFFVRSIRGTTENKNKMSGLLTEFDQDVFVAFDGCVKIVVCQHQHSIVNLDCWFGLTVHQAGKGKQARSKCNEQHFLLYFNSTDSPRKQKKRMIGNCCWPCVVAVVVIIVVGMQHNSQIAHNTNQNGKENGQNKN